MTMQMEVMNQLSGSGIYSADSGSEKDVGK